MERNEHMERNRKLWDEKTVIHKQSEFYGVEEFKAGRSTLKPLEVEEVGPVEGKSMLHLQCHFGLDTLSWARKGARVTGVDFSGKAIDFAREMASELEIPSRFILANIYELPKVINDRFDIVFTSYGVLCWLPDLKEWAKVAAHFLKEGGMFYLVDEHPLNNIFDNQRQARSLEVRYSYFHSSLPTCWEPEGTYADRNALIKNPSYEWTHSLSDIINSLISAGLRLEFFHEFPFGTHDHYPFMERDNDGWWRLQGVEGQLPLIFSLRARKEG